MEPPRTIVMRNPAGRSIWTNGPCFISRLWTRCRAWASRRWQKEFIMQVQLNDNALNACLLVAVVAVCLYSLATVRSCGAAADRTTETYIKNGYCQMQEVGSTGTLWTKCPVKPEPQP